MKKPKIDPIDRNELMKYPIRLDNYDKENGNEHFVLGGESVLEYAASLPRLDGVMPVKDDDFGAVCNCAVRYSLGRMTYMPSIVIGFIRPRLSLMTNRTLWCFERDLEGAQSYGDEQIDKPLWVDFLAAVKAEIAARDAKGEGGADE